jgi:hypothetical protein
LKQNIVRASLYFRIGAAVASGHPIVSSLDGTADTVPQGYADAIPNGIHQCTWASGPFHSHDSHDETAIDSFSTRVYDRRGHHSPTNVVLMGVGLGVRRPSIMRLNEVLHTTWCT